MKKALLVGALALTLGITGIAYAHGPDGGGCGGGHGHGGGMRGHGMMRDLNLTQQQQDQIHTIMDKQHESAQKQIRAVLTPEQQKTFDQRIAQRNADWKARKATPQP